MNDTKILNLGKKIKSENIMYNDTSLKQKLDEYEQKFEDGYVFSTEETKIGKWIDGKDLYSITFDAGYLGNNGRTMPNISNIIPATASVKFVFGDAHRSPSGGSGYNDFIPLWAACSSILIRPELGYAYIDVTTDRTAWRATITVIYTKATD